MDKSVKANDALEERIGYHFKQKTLLEQSLTHPSFYHNSRRSGEHNQRLEFLGDAILSAILAEALYTLFPDVREGVLSRQRSMLARGAFLSGLAHRLGLHQHLRLSRIDALHGGCERESTLEDGLEALVGAIYLDSDFTTTRRVVLGWFGDIQQVLDCYDDVHNPKGQLQELVQTMAGNDAVEYRVVEECGPDHDKTFCVKVAIEGVVQGTGTGSSKKEAEENAARAALAKKMNLGKTG